MSAATVTSSVSPALPLWRDPAAWTKSADIVAVLIALSLPWSTSLVGIFGVVLLVIVAPTLDFRLFLQSLKRPISALPIALFVLALVGHPVVGCALGRAQLCLESRGQAPGVAAAVLSFRAFDARHVGVRRLPRLLRAADGDVLAGAFESRLSRSSTPIAERGIFVKNYIDQSQEFALCAVALAYPAVTLLRERKIWQALLLIAHRR